MAEFYVKVEPDSDEFRLQNGSILKVFLEEPAENGRANSELVSRLSDILGQKPGIVSGHKSKRKKIRVDMSEREVDERLEEAF